MIRAFCYTLLISLAFIAQSPLYAFQGAGNVSLSCVPKDAHSALPFGGHRAYSLLVRNNIATLKGGSDEWSYRVIDGDHDREWVGIGANDFTKTGYFVLLSVGASPGEVIFKWTNLYSEQISTFRCK